MKHSETVCVCRSSQPNHHEFKSEKHDQKTIFSITSGNLFMFFHSVFLKENNSKVQVQQQNKLCCLLKFWPVEHAADPDHWSEVSVPFAMAEACFEYTLVVHWSEPGRSEDTI